MNWLDTTIIAVLGLGALFGALSGLLKQMARLVGFGVALVAAIYLHDWAAARLSQHVLHDAEPHVIAVVSYVVVFLVIYLAIFWVSLLLERFVTAIRLQMVNRALGGVLGSLKAALILGAVFLALTTYASPRTQELLAQSHMAPLLAEGIEKVIATIPGYYNDDLRTSLKDLNKFTP